MLYNTPGYINKIDFIRPIGLTPIQYKNFIKRRNYIISLNKKAYFQQLEFSKRYQKLERIRDRILFYHSPSFITLTLNDRYVNINHQNLIRSIRYEFKKYNINYYILCEDYGKITNRLHFHGFIDFIDKSGFTYKGYCRGKIRYTLQLNVGLLLVDIFDDYMYALRYALKYSLKDDLKVPPKVIYSKSMPLLEKLKNFFEIENILLIWYT